MIDTLLVVLFVSLINVFDSPINDTEKHPLWGGFREMAFGTEASGQGRFL